MRVREIEFDEPLDLLFHRDQTLPLHTNGMRFTALDANGAVVHRDEFYSVGGGFIARAAEFGRREPGRAPLVPEALPRDPLHPRLGEAGAGGAGA